MNIQQISINDLKPYPQNAKKHPSEQVEHIANSIREFGFQQPIVVDKDNVVVIGHGRLLAAKKLNMDSVPCVRADDLTDEQIKALRLADNKTNESEWDFDLLDMELSDIEIDMEQFGFEKEEKEEKIDAEVEFSEILNEESNYLILKFDNEIDWLQAETFFNLKPKMAYSTRKDGQIKGNKKVGIGRVINGSDFFQKIGVIINEDINM